MLEKRIQAMFPEKKIEKIEIVDESNELINVLLLKALANVYYNVSEEKIEISIESYDVNLVPADQQHEIICLGTSYVGHIAFDITVKNSVSGIISKLSYKSKNLPCSNFSVFDFFTSWEDILAAIIVSYEGMNSEAKYLNFVKRILNEIKLCYKKNILELEEALSASIQ